MKNLLWFYSIISWHFQAWTLCFLTFKKKIWTILMVFCFPSGSSWRCWNHSCWSKSCSNCFISPFMFECFQFWFSFCLNVQYFLTSVSNNNCSFLWRPTFLGRTSTCQRSRPCTHCSWWVLTSQVGRCNKFHAWSQGNLIFWEIRFC